jgi:DNA-binding NarL/FixJ family response regulator|tara:strand:- start:2517 stop:3164 length:648 start_codon:yes stop_codon:yes gene_type:complete
MTVFTRKVLVVEDDQFMGSLISQALSSAGFETKHVISAVEAKRSIGAFDPDIALIDIDLGDGPNGIDLVHMLLRIYPGVKLVILSTLADAKSAGLGALDVPAGVTYLRKSLIHDVNEFISTIELVIGDNNPEIRQDLEVARQFDGVSKVQREILHMMSLGLSNREIASRRKVSLSNIEQRLTEIYKALEIAKSEATVPRVEAILKYLSMTGTAKH